MLREKSLLLFCCRSEFTSFVNLDQQSICKEVLLLLVGCRVDFCNNNVQPIVFSEV